MSVCSIFVQILKAALSYDRYTPGDEVRPEYRNDFLLSLMGSLLPPIRGYCRYEVVGLESVRSSGRAVLAANHAILPVDALLLHHAIKEAFGRGPRGFTDWRVFRIPVLSSPLKRWLLEAVQKVPDARQAKSRGMRRTSCTLNDEG
jgi:1-acyl-sn-glycerol-3-phosphate acyltransferase